MGGLLGKSALDHLLLGSVVPPLLEVCALDKEPPITPEEPVPVVVPISSQSIRTYKPLLHLAVDVPNLQRERWALSVRVRGRGEGGGRRSARTSCSPAFFSSASRSLSFLLRLCFLPSSMPDDLLTSAAEPRPSDWAPLRNFVELLTFRSLDLQKARNGQVGQREQGRKKMIQLRNSVPIFQDVESVG